MQGKIIKLISNDYSVLTDEGVLVCKARGKFRNMKVSPLVGDEVIIDKDNKCIKEILKRRNELVRPPVANIDQVVIIANVYPQFDTNLLDKLLVIIEYNNIEPVICITKMDLISDSEKEEINRYINYYKKIGYKVYVNTDIENISKLFKDKVSVFTGQSGAGKSTLLNRLDESLNIKTDEISLALGRGKHTTRHVELLSLCDGLIADTPGFSSLSFIGMTKEDIRDNFIEFNTYRHDCEYKDCMHVSETKCEVKKQLEENNIIKERYENYLKFINKG